MCPKIFVSGCWDKRGEIHKIIKEFESIVDVTHDWTVHEDESLFNNKSYLKCQALLGTDGIDRADYLVVIMGSEGASTWTEIGMAISSGISVLMYDCSAKNNYENNIYIHHPLVKKFNNLNDIAEYLKN